MKWLNTLRIRIPALAIIISLLLVGCFSKSTSIRIEQKQISMASFSCISFDECWAFVDGDANSGLRRGFLELNGKDWDRKEDWGNWSDAIEMGVPRGKTASLSFLKKDTGWLTFKGNLYKKNPPSFIDENEKSGSFNSSWSFIPNPFSPEIQKSGPIKEVYFLDSQHGWLLSDTREIAITTNGGDDWNTYPIAGGSSFSALFFLDSSRGWIGPNDRDLMKTINGGEDWEIVSSFSTTNSVTQLHFSDPNHGWVVVNGYSYPSHTDDGGHTWTYPPEETHGLKSVYFFDQLHGWAIIPDQGIVFSSDGGKTWASQNIANHWHEHPVNLVWKVPAWIVGGTLVAIASIPEWLAQAGALIGLSS